jgi:transposase
VKQDHNIILVVDYHPENMVARWFNPDTGEERVHRRPTCRKEILSLVHEAVKEAIAQGGRVIWIMESTTGWARVQELIGNLVEFCLINVLQMPKAPKEHRRKTDKIDTQRALREHLAGKLPLAYQPSPWLRRLRRQVDGYYDLVRRQTMLRNWIWQLLAHETWASRENLWSAIGLRRLRGIPLDESDRQLVEHKLSELELLDKQIAQVESQLMAVYDEWPEAQRLDRVRGIAPLTAVAILAYIGPIGRFVGAQELIGFAGLAPGVRSSDGKSRSLRIGGGGTHARLRYFLLQAVRWLREMPRYKPTFDRVSAKHGKKAGRVAVGRMFLRSLDKMLRSGVEFSAG